MRMFTAKSRRFTRTNDYRMGGRFPARTRTKDRIRMVRPADGPAALMTLRTDGGREGRSGLKSAA